jgi:HEAT repeat protein
MKACARIGPNAHRAVPIIVKAFKGTKANDKLKQIVNTLQLIGPPAKEAVPELKREILSDNPNGTIALDLARALAEIGASGEIVLFGFLKDKDEFAQFDAARVLGYLKGKPRSETVKALINRLGSDSELDCFIIISLGRLGHKAKEAAPALRKIIESPPKYDNDGLDDNWYMVKPFAQWALRRITDEYPTPMPFVNKLEEILIGRSTPLRYAEYNPE